MDNSGGSAPLLVMKGSAFKQEMGIQRALSELSKSEAQQRWRDGSDAFGEFVETEARDLLGDTFTSFMQSLYKQVRRFIDSDDVYEKRAGVIAIDQLIDLKLMGEKAAKVENFGTYLSEVMQHSQDRSLLQLSAQVMGHLVRSNVQLTAALVDSEVKRAISWLRARDKDKEAPEHTKYAATLILKQMAQNSPAVFNVHVRGFIDVIWNALRFHNREIRESAVEALSACLVLVEKRETRYRVQWYYRLFEETQRGLTRYPNNVEVVHGSLLALGELLRHTGEFMLARYREVVETVLQPAFRDSKEKLIRYAVVRLIPLLAAFAPERFAASYLKTCLEHLLIVLRNPSERGKAFEALGETARALSKVGSTAGIEAALPRIADCIREALPQMSRSRSSSGGFSLEALQCAGVLAKALGYRWQEHAERLIKPMKLTGLSEQLIQAYKDIVENLPELIPLVKEELSDLLNVVLNREQKEGQSRAEANALAMAVECGPVKGAALVRLAFVTLGRYDFAYNPKYLEPVKMLGYLDDENESIRRAAALAFCRVQHRNAKLQKLVRSKRDRAGSHYPLVAKGGTKVVETVLNRLLMAAVADVSQGVRQTVLAALVEDEDLDAYLAQAECLRALFIALNDESATVRALAISLAGRLAPRNPAYVLPALRNHLQQLLADMERSPDSRQREDSAGLLGALISSSPRLVLPYVPPILRALLSKLRVTTQMLSLQVAPAVAMPKGPAQPGGGESGVMARVLETLGELARVAGLALRPHVPEILPLVIDALNDASNSKKAVAITTLGQVVESTGCVMVPYQQYPNLMGALLLMLADRNNETLRYPVIIVLGIIGALDPHTHKLNQADLQGEGKLEAEGVRPQRPPAYHHPGGHGEPRTLEAMGGDTWDGELLPATGLVTSSEEYYPTVAINALMRSLRDAALSSQHFEVVRSLFHIFQALGLSAVPYLPKVMPVLINVLHQSKEEERKALVENLASLVSLLRQHLRKWLPDLLHLIHLFWTSDAQLQAWLLRLISELAVSLRDDMRAYLPDVLPKFIALFQEAEREGSYQMVQPALDALEALGPALEDHLQLLLPALVRLIPPGGSSKTTPPAIRRATLQSMQRLLPRMALAKQASSVLHPMLRLLDGEHDELRRDALDTICALAQAIGPGLLAIFVHVIQKLMQRHKIHHEKFARLAAKLLAHDPPCMSEAQDWETSNAWLDTLVPPPRPETLTSSLPDAPVGPDRLAVNEAVLRRAWESSQRSTPEDWAEWARHFAVELLRNSPSPALRANYKLAEMHPQMARDLFPAGFVSCWGELSEAMQGELVRSLEAALASPSIPADIVTALLNLAEFMEHNEKSLPLDTRTLGALAEKCHAYAKALHYKELEFQTSPESCVEALISINNQLRQPEAAIGILTYAQQTLHMELKESWYEKLNRWEEALKAYDAKREESPPGTIAHLEASMGRLRCLAALAEWSKLTSECRKEWKHAEPHVRRDMAGLAAHAAWHMGHWDEMAVYTADMRTMESSTAAFLTSVQAVHNRNFGAAKLAIERSRELLGSELAALVGESYERAYGDMVRVQQLTELEEVIRYQQIFAGETEAEAEARRGLTRAMWRGRLKGVQRNVEVWQALLSVRSLVLPRQQDTHTWLKFASLARKSGRTRQSLDTLISLLGYNPARKKRGEPGWAAGTGLPDIMFGYLKHLWSSSSKDASIDAYQRLQELTAEVSALPDPQRPGSGQHHGNSLVAVPGAGMEDYKAPLIARVHLRLGMWRWTITPAEELDASTIDSVLSALHTATQTAPEWGKAWHNWALFNVLAIDHYAHSDIAAAKRHVAPAVNGFFRSVALGQATGEPLRGAKLQDILRLLTLWFNHGNSPDVEAALKKGFGHVSIDTWLVVIPQVIARIHTSQVVVRRLINSLLIRIGSHHPQALMYPLLVACKSQSSNRRSAAQEVMDNLRQHSNQLVEQAYLVSEELIRMAILWHEMWHEALEEASRQYFGESNVEGMLNTLIPLHEMLQKQEPATLKEIAFTQAYGKELAEAYEWLQKYRLSRKEAELHQAWDLYYHVFKRINKQLPSLVMLELHYVSPALAKAEGLELAVPGTYIAGAPVVTIAAFAPQLTVITSKQRPRKLTIHGSDGAEYMFLLKGHEDLRQDERVMQLFGLVNAMLSNDRSTAERDLSIARYAVIPLSPNSGLIGWVPNTDTLHALIREFRDTRKIPLNVEHRLMLGMAPDYDHLTVIQKVEVFQHALESTSGEDLHKVLWLKSRNSEVWLDRRTTYTRSTAVMSMVGYLLGLGDRHPSNLMLDRYSGKLLHIDFGDCFEASMNREKFPEKVPFRLTRMMERAMEVSGIEGNFRFTCENVMKVLRSNKDSVMAMLEAFVHDPLINWRLLNTTDTVPDAAMARDADASPDLPTKTSGGVALSNIEEEDEGTSIQVGTMPSPPRREAREKELLLAYGQLGAANEVLNERAVAVMKRMSDKLTGRDFLQEGAAGIGAETDGVQQQVHRLLNQATSHENLCQSYIGWCPFW